MIAGFILAHFCLLLILLGVILPRYYNIFIPEHRRAEGTEETIPLQLKEAETLPAFDALDVEHGPLGNSSVGQKPSKTTPEYSSNIPKP